MTNQAMKRKLDEGDCLDVTEIGNEIEVSELDERRGVRIFELEPDEFEDDMDYCIAETESWIWSIGKRKSDGKILASTDARFYQNADYDCLWLR